MPKQVLVVEDNDVNFALVEFVLFLFCIFLRERIVCQVLNSYCHLIYNRDMLKLPLV